jgi:hypothetical protein
VLQQRRLPPAVGCAAEALPLVQSLPKLEQTYCPILRHEEMATRHNACREIEKALETKFALVAHKPTNKSVE